MSIVSTISKNDWRGGPSKDYQYSYGDEVYVDRPRKVSERSSVERQQRNSVDRKQETGKGNRQSEERKMERQRQSEETVWTGNRKQEKETDSQRKGRWRDRDSQKKQCGQETGNRKRKQTVRGKEDGETETVRRK